MNQTFRATAQAAELTTSAKAELVLLSILLFVLPTMEAPKQVIAVLYLLVWLGRRFSLSALLRWRPDLIEMSLLAMIAASVASTIVNWPLASGTKGLSDTSRYVILFWCIYRAGYEERHLRVLAYSMVAGVLAGLAYGVFETLQGYRRHLEFNSAGIVTQSSVYLAIAAMATIGLAWDAHHARPRQRIRWFWDAAVLVMVCGLFAMGSRNALLAFGATLFALLILLKDRRVWYTATLAIAAGAVVVITLPSSFQAQRAFTKMRTLTEERLPTADVVRLHIWRLAVAHLKCGEHLVFGVGPRNFAAIDPKAVALPESLPSDFKLSHAHQMYLGRLVEEGLFGLGAFLFFVMLVATALFRDWRMGDWEHWKWIAAFGALLVPSIAGLFNGAFFNEQAMLAMALIGIYLSSRRLAATDFKVLPAPRPPPMRAAL